MIEIIKELNIEVSKPNVFQAVVAKQYDMNTRFIKATFVDGENKIEINHESTVSVVINALRPDGEAKGFDGVVNDDGTVTVPLHSWMLELVGTVICDISVIDIESEDNKKLTTTSFTLIVEKAAFGGDDITSDPQSDVIVSLVEAVTEASVVAEEALQKSNEALSKSAEANSKYEACVEATENANAVREEIEAGGYIESLKECNVGGKFSTWIGTTAEYNALVENNAIIQNCFYILTDDATIHDFVVAQGTIKPYSDSIFTWNFRKWNNGDYEVWTRYTTAESNICRPWGALYISGTAEETSCFSVELPRDFKSIDVTNIIVEKPGCVIWAIPDGTTEKGTLLDYYVCSTSSFANLKFDVMISIKGKWK